MPNITVSFNCTNSAQAAKMIEFFDRINAEAMQQMADSMGQANNGWTEFTPNNEVRPAEPVNAVAPHVAQPNASVVPQDAVGSAPIPYAQQPAPQIPPAAVPNMTPPAPIPSAQPAPAPQYQQTAMPYAPMTPNAVPSSAPVVRRDQLQNALQLFASSSPARSGQIRDVLAHFGVDSINAVPDAALPEFASACRSLGVSI